MFYDNFILADDLFAKALRSLETCLLVDNNLCGKLISSLESLITFESDFTTLSFLIPDFNLWVVT